MCLICPPVPLIRTQGSLDLTGRARPRYQSLIRRFRAFVADVNFVKTHATQITIDEDLAVRDGGWIVRPISVLNVFTSKWQLDATFLSDIFAKTCKLLPRTSTLFNFRVNSETRRFHSGTPGPSLPGVVLARPSSRAATSHHKDRRRCLRAYLGVNLSSASRSSSAPHL